MKLESTFDLGDRVWLIRRHHKIETDECPVCLGHGKVKGADGTGVHCRPCSGRGWQNAKRWKEWEIARDHPTLTIGQIEVRVRDDRRSDDRKERYMAFETGVGSGRVYYPEDLYSTKDAALEECARRNKIELETEPA
jgi:hypothetical protein